MTNILPLLLMWLWSQRHSAPAAIRTNPYPQPPVPPQWPTASSPPPPIPAFTPNAPPDPSANTGTPLHQLHNAPPAPAPAHAPPKAAAKPKPKVLTAAVQRARSAVKLPSLNATLASTPAKQASVSELQAIVNSHGGSLKRDGLYGPKTAAAWSALAKKRGLPATITRTGPKTAKVAVQTFDQLSMPAIP